MDKLSTETINKLVENTHLLLAYQSTTDGLIEKIKELQKLLDEVRANGVWVYQWKPIADAPKDGTFILTWNSNGINEVYWDADNEWWYHDVDGDNVWPLRGGYPTLWADLPPAPKE